ncbi:MAG: 5-(carboxyamino)imidazole ribonucleotide synthase [bacterium]|nr:5-(carboxyamino)imidazole ribonucleotide synthase [bacterium]
MTTIGILGGGQLAQMTLQAAISLGLETVIFERFADSPAARFTPNAIVADWQDRAALQRFADLCDVATLENEFVDAEVLASLEASGLPIYPTSSTLTLVQDKFWQKNRIADEAIPVPAYRAVESPDDVLEAGQEFGWPLVLKTRRDGYDGYGNATLHSAADLADAWNKLAASGRKLMVEQFVPFERELAVIVVRGRDGSLAAYPVVETVQQNHICHVVRAPAPILTGVQFEARRLACAAVEAVQGIGVFGIELFLLPDGRLLFNEMAPRPHNSGHYTIEACETSQFENHLRAIMGWPLGSVEMVAPAAVMVNLLGQRTGGVENSAIREALRVSGAQIHLYGKRDVRPGRKMGHITVLGKTLQEAETVAQRAANAVRL